MAFVRRCFCTNIWSWWYHAITLQLISASPSAVANAAVRPTASREDSICNVIHQNTPEYVRLYRCALLLSIIIVMPSSSLKKQIMHSRGIMRISDTTQKTYSSLFAWGCMCCMRIWRLDSDIDRWEYRQKSRKIERKNEKRKEYYFQKKSDFTLWYASRNGSPAVTLSYNRSVR